MALYTNICCIYMHICAKLYAHLFQISCLYHKMHNSYTTWFGLTYIFFRVSVVLEVGFSVAAPSLWNLLPLNVRLVSKSTQRRHHLKAYLMRLSDRLLGFRGFRRKLGMILTYGIHLYICILCGNVLHTKSKNRRPEHTCFTVVS